MADSGIKPSELFTENTVLKKNFDELQRSRERRIRHPSLPLNETDRESEEHEMFICDHGHPASSPKQMCSQKVRSCIIHFY